MKQAADPTNKDRAAWADHALQMFQMTTGADREDAVSDLLANLMHLADDEGTDFAADLERASMHYTAEIEEAKHLRTIKRLGKLAADVPASLLDSLSNGEG